MSPALGPYCSGIALGLTNASAVSGLPAGWGGALGLAGAHGVAGGIALIPNPQIANPARFAALLLFGVAGLTLGYFALGLNEDERAWIAGVFRRTPRERRAAPRRTQMAEERVTPAAPPKSKPAVAVSEPARLAAPSARSTARKPAASQPTLAFGDSFQPRPSISCPRARKRAGIKSIGRA